MPKTAMYVKYWRRNDKITIFQVDMEELSHAIATFEECFPLLIGTKDELSQKVAVLAMENNDLDQVYFPGMLGLLS